MVLLNLIKKRGRVMVCASVFLPSIIFAQSSSVMSPWDKCHPALEAGYEQVQVLFNACLGTCQAGDSACNKVCLSEELDKIDVLNATYDKCYKSISYPNSPVEQTTPVVIPVTSVSTSSTSTPPVDSSNNNPVPEPDPPLSPGTPPSTSNNPPVQTVPPTYTPISIPSVPVNNSGGSGGGSSGSGNQAPIPSAPAALGMVGNYYGVSIPTADIINMIGSGGEDATLSQLFNTAQKMGFTKTQSSFQDFNSADISSWSKYFNNGAQSLLALTKAIAKGNPVIVNVGDSPFSDGYVLIITGVSNGNIYVENPVNVLKNNISGKNTQIIKITEFMSMWQGKGYSYIIPLK